MVSRDIGTLRATLVQRSQTVLQTLAIATEKRMHESICENCDIRKSNVRVLCTLDGRNGSRHPASFPSLRTPRCSTCHSSHYNCTPGVRVSGLRKTFGSPFARGFDSDRARSSFYVLRLERAFLAETVLTRLAARLFNGFRLRRAVFGALLILAAIVPNAEPIVRATVTSVSFSVLPVCLCDFVFIPSSV
jgi:hypothetical protein